MLERLFALFQVPSAKFKPEEESMVCRTADGKLFFLDAKGRLVSRDGEVLVHSYEDILWGDAEGYTFSPITLAEANVSL